MERTLCLPESEWALFLKRLRKVRDDAGKIGWGVSEAMAELWYEMLDECEADASG